MLSLAGFPPTAGFFGKLFLFTAAIDQGFVLLALMAAIATVISVYFYLRIIVLMYFHQDEGVQEIEVSRGMAALITASTTAVLFFGLFPSVLMSWASASVPF